MEEKFRLNLETESLTAVRSSGSNPQNISGPSIGALATYILRQVEKDSANVPVGRPSASKREFRIRRRTPPTVFTGDQLQILEQVFAVKPYLDLALRERIAQLFGVSASVILA